MGKCVIAGRECPRTNNPEAKHYCPFWTDGRVWDNKANGEARVINCAAAMVEPGIIQILQSSDRPAETAEQTRNEIVRGMNTIVNMVGRALNFTVGPKQVTDERVKNDQ